MGSYLSCCCPDNTPSALKVSDARAALRAGGRIQVKKNDVEDPHAPLLTKSRDTPKSKENELIDKELNDYVQALSSDDDIDANDADMDAILKETSD